MQFDDSLVESFTDKFYGYGNLDGRLWFVGMEESGGGFEEIARRFSTWDRRGRRTVEDVAKYHLDLGLDANFRERRPKIQRTWQGLMLIALTVQGRPTDIETVREYQRAEWGSALGPIALLELLPLPSPSIGQWIYGDHSHIPCLHGRRDYEREMLPKRKGRLKNLIAERKPTAVVFYGKKYHPHWQEIAGGNFEELAVPHAQVNAAMNHALKRIVIEQDGDKREVQLIRYAVPVIYLAKEISRLTGKPEPQPRDWLPTWEQFAAFIDGIGHHTASGVWDKNSENLFRYIVMGPNLAARPQAILQLNVSTQVDFDAGLVRLNPPGRRQTKKVRPTVPLTENLRAWLKHWNCDHPIHRSGKPLTTIKKVFKRHALKMGMPLFTPYTIRHFWATQIKRIEGTTVAREQRKEWLGHSHRDTTSWYEHYDPEWLQEAKVATDRLMERLEGLLKKRTVRAPASQTTPKTETAERRLKWVVSK